MSQTTQTIDPNMKAGPSIKDVYGDRLPVIREGWELDGPEYFRAVTPGALTLPATNCVSPLQWSEADIKAFSEPIYRIHVRRKRAPIAASHAYTITVGEVYGGPVEIPEEYDYVGFGLAGGYEKYIAKRSRAILSGPSPAPRIIVRRKDGARD